MKTKVWSSLRSIGQKWNIDPKEFVLWLFPFILFSPGILGGKVFFWGTILLQFIPWRHLALETIKMGELPLWNPYSGMGAPLLANYQSALLYPPSWGLLALEAIGGVVWSAIGQGLFLALHLGFCAVGMKRWLEALGVGSLGQMVGGIAFGLSGYLVSRASFQSIIFSASWMPWIFVYAQKTMHTLGGERRKNLFWLILVIAMNLLAGHAQTSWYILWSTSAWVVWQSLFARRGKWSERWQTFVNNMSLWSIAVGWAILIAAAQLFPTGEYLLNSQRSTGIDREIGLTYSFWPWRFLTFLMPNFFGNPAQGNYWGYANYWEDAVYSGSMAVLIGIFGIGRVLCNSKRKSLNLLDRDVLRQSILFWWLVCILTMILALGRNFPFYYWFLEHVPGFDLFQAPTRVSLVAQFGLAVLAAIGIDLWDKPQCRLLYWTRLVTAGFFSMFIVSSIAYFQYQNFYPTILRSVQQFGLSGLIFGIILLMKPADHSLSSNFTNIKSWFQFSGWWKILVFSFFLVDLISMGWGLNPVISIEIYREHPVDHLQLGNKTPSHRCFINALDEHKIKFEKYFRFDTFRNLDDWISLRRSMLPNLNLLDGTAMINNFDPLLPARFTSWLSAMNEAQENGDELNYQRFLKMSGVKTLIKLEDETLILTPIEGEDRFRFFLCANSVRTVTEALDAVLTDPEVGVTKIVIETSSDNERDVCSTPQGYISHSIKILSESANRVQVEVHTSQKGWLVMKDTYYPGWTARINGVKKPFFAANSVFRAVQVEAGTNVVEFFYQPLSFYLGVAFSVFSLITLILFRGVNKGND